MNYVSMKRHGGILNLSGRSQHEKFTYYMIPCIWHSGKGRTREIVKKLLIAKGWKEEGWIGRT